MSEEKFKGAFSTAEKCPPNVIKREETKVDAKSKQYLDYIPFGANNLFPQCLSSIKRKAAIHNSIISWKTTYMIGSGIEETGDAKLDEWVNNADGKGNGVREISERHFTDDNTFGNYYQVFKTDKRKSFLLFKHVQSVNVRYKRLKEGDVPSILVHPDWVNYQNNKGLTTEIAIYPNYSESDDGFLLTCIPIKDYEPEYKHYGLPTYVAGLSTVAIGYKTDKWNESRLDNTFQVSGVLEVSVDDEEKAGELLDGIKSSYSGEGNNSKLLGIVRRPGQEGTSKFTPFVQNSEGEFVDIHDISTNDQITAHKWFKTLSGVTGSTGFEEGGKQMLTEFSVAIEKVVKPKQKSYLKALGVILKDFGFNPNAVDELTFRNDPPLSAWIHEIDVNSVVKKGVAAELLGIDKDTMTEQEQNEFIKSKPVKSSENGSNNN